MWRLFRAELMKIRRSLIWLIVIAIPLLIALPLYIGLARSPIPVAWHYLTGIICQVWSWFLLPMSVTIITALMGQVEHRYNTWSYMMSLPQSKRLVLLTKALMAVLIIALMSLLIFVVSIGASVLGSLSNPNVTLMDGQVFRDFGHFLYEIWLASFLVIAVQFYVAMRFGGLAIPLLTGVGGTFFAVLASMLRPLGISFEDGNYLPWLLPANVIQRPAEADSFVLVGGVGGAVALIFVVLMLARKDWN